MATRSPYPVLAHGLVPVVALDDIAEAGQILWDTAPAQKILVGLGRACFACPLFEARQRQWKNQVHAMIDNALGRPA